MDNDRDYLLQALAEVDALISAHATAIDPNPRSQWPKGSVLERAINRHEIRETWRT